jgi:hypothetical protein
VDLPLDIDAGGGGELLGGMAFEGCLGIGDHKRSGERRAKGEEFSA